jgi:hypothetical protein
VSAAGKGTFSALRDTTLTTAGIVTNDASGNLGTSKAITGIDSIRIIDGAQDTLVIGAGGKKWKFLPIANQ